MELFGIACLLLVVGGLFGWFGAKVYYKKRPEKL